MAPFTPLLPAPLRPTPTQRRIRGGLSRAAFQAPIVVLDRQGLPKGFGFLALGAVSAALWWGLAAGAMALIG